MATLTFKLRNICTGGNHADLYITGDYNKMLPVDVGTFTDPIPDEDVEAFIRVLLRIKSVDYTKAQIKTALSSANGITVNI